MKDDVKIVVSSRNQHALAAALNAIHFFLRMEHVPCHYGTDLTTGELGRLVRQADKEHPRLINHLSAATLFADNEDISVHAPDAEQIKAFKKANPAAVWNNQYMTFVSRDHRLMFEGWLARGARKN